MKSALGRSAKYICAFLVWFVFGSLIDLFFLPILARHTHYGTADRVELMLLVALFLLCALATRLVGRHKNKIVAPQSPPDPRKWHLDPHTGEYSRIKSGFMGYVHLNKNDTYAERVYSEYIRRGFLRAGLIILIASWFVFYGAQTYDNELSYYGTTSIWALIAMVCSGAFMLFGAGLTLGFLPYRSFGRRIGPLPVPVPGREEVERQKVHGEGGFATREQIDRVAYHRQQTRADEQTFDD
jgi:hypothetical protein